MAEGRERSQWSQMSSLMAVIVNVNRNPRRGRAAKPSDFNPFSRRDAPTMTTRELSDLLVAKK